MTTWLPIAVLAGVLLLLGLLIWLTKDAESRGEDLHEGKQAQSDLKQREKQAEAAAQADYHSADARRFADELRRIGRDKLSGAGDS